MTQCTKPDALKSQVGGNHYSKMKIQPMEFAMANKWDAGAFSILKYVTRYMDKNGLQDLQKARHFVDLREELLHGRHQAIEVMEIGDYCRANGFRGLQAHALIVLSMWVWTGNTRDRLELISAIEQLMRDFDRPVNSAEQTQNI
ncbi:DUF3310 domain-containing protein [Sinorhizobium medicae]|nr:DUF3310 domain-containing protein [Sinorhizobium medicae]